MTDYNKLVEKQIRGILKDISEIHGLDFDDLSKKYLHSTAKAEAKAAKDKAKAEAKAAKDKEKEELKMKKIQEKAEAKAMKAKIQKSKSTIKVDQMQEYRNKKQIEWEQQEEQSEEARFDEDQKIRNELSKIYTDPLRIEQEIEYRRSLEVDSRN